MRHTRERRRERKNAEVLHSWAWGPSNEWDPNEWEDTENTWTEKFEWSRRTFG